MVHFSSFELDTIVIRLVYIKFSFTGQITQQKPLHYFVSFWHLVEPSTHVWTLTETICPFVGIIYCRIEGSESNRRIMKKHFLGENIVFCVKVSSKWSLSSLNDCSRSKGLIADWWAWVQVPCPNQIPIQVLTPPICTPLWHYLYLGLNHLEFYFKFRFPRLVIVDCKSRKILL